MKIIGEYINDKDKRCIQIVMTEDDLFRLRKVLGRSSLLINTRDISQLKLKDTVYSMIDCIDKWKDSKKETQ